MRQINGSDSGKGKMCIDNLSFLLSTTKSQDTLKRNVAKTYKMLWPPLTDWLISQFYLITKSLLDFTS